MRRRTTSVALLATLLAGCAMFRAGQQPPVPDWPPPSAMARHTITLLIGGETIVNGTSQEAAAQFLDKWRALTFQAYRDSGLFSDVAAGVATTDRRAEISIRDRGEWSMGLAVVSGLTLTLFPSTAYDELLITTVVKDAGGKVLGTYRKSEKLTLWTQLFLVFLMPAHFPKGVTEDAFRDLHRATITDAHAQGVF